MRVTIIGAGIVGASIAYHLAQHGVSVVLLENDRPGGGTSGATFACLNIFGHRSDSFFDLRLRSIRYLDTLAAEIDAVEFVHKPGTLRWGESDGDWTRLHSETKRLEDRGLPCEYHSAAQVRAELEPALDLSRLDNDVIRVPEEGWLDAPPFIGKLLAAARAVGDVETRDAKAIDLDFSGPAVKVVTTSGTIDSDRLVLAAGIDSIAMCERVGHAFPIERHPGVMRVSAPSATPLHHVVYASDMHLRPDGAGRIMAGLGDAHRAGPTPTQSQASQEALRIEELGDRWLPGFRATPAEAIRVGIRTIWPDDLPVVGWLPNASNAYIAVYHSGITLAPLLGQLCAREIAGDAAGQGLDSYRPDRFDQDVPSVA